MSGFLAQGGGYRNLRVYKLTEIIYDLSVVFAEKFIRKGSRTRDQIEQAAYMLRRLLERQQEQFLQSGGIREQMHRARLDYRSRTGQTGQTSQTPNTTKRHD